MTKSQYDFNHCLCTIELMLAVFYEGRFKNVYINLAIELNKLLCEGKASLFEIVTPDIKLMRIANADLNFPPVKRFFSTPFEVAHRQGRPLNARLNISSKFEPMRLKEWIAQPFYNPEITIDELISSIRDKIGAHSDKNVNETIINSSSIQYDDSNALNPAMISLANHVIQCVHCYENNIDIVDYFTKFSSLKNWESQPFYKALP